MCSRDTIQYNPEGESNNTLRTAEFGSLHYQELMLYRTNLVMDLLILGFRCIIVDIDTVWLEDPLVAVADAITGYELISHSNETSNSIDSHPRVSFDIAITDDNGEVCGCFVVLNSTINTLSFWRQVSTEHTNITNYGLEQGMLDKFSDSEQKILTRLIYERQYFRSSSDSSSK